MTNNSVQVKGHFLDFDENSNWYMIPTEQYSHFLEWVQDHRLDYEVDSKDLLPGMIPVADVTSVVITDYTILSNDS